MINGGIVLKYELIVVDVVKIKKYARFAATSCQVSRKATHAATALNIKQIRLQSISNTLLA
jgi:hypothetical protein